MPEQQHARLGTDTGGSTSNGREREQGRRSVSSTSSNATIQATRPRSSLSSGSGHAAAAAARVPFTPGATNKTSKIANIGLSAKQVDKLSETIADIRRGPSISRNRDSSSSTLQSKPAHAAVAAAGDAELHDRKGKGKGQRSTSFANEELFTDVLSSQPLLYLKLRS